MDYAIVLLLLALSALFSGLTLGLMSLDVHALRRKMALGDDAAARIYEVRRRGNELLTALLLGNVTVNAILAIFLGDMTTGVAAAFIATALIFVFGEIIPQAAMTRHAMRVGAVAAPFVRGLLMVTSPITYPAGKMLDWVLGEELPDVYSKHELMEIIAEHEDSEHSPLDSDEERILHGALSFSNKPVHEVMTPSEYVFAYEADQVLDRDFRKTLLETGRSRFPIYRRNKNNIVGILYAKDLLLEPLDETAIEACDRSFLLVRPNETLDTIMSYMLKRKLHLGVVMDHDDTFLGVIALEDILEEVLQTEIRDEDDHMVHSS